LIKIFDQKLIASGMRGFGRNYEGIMRGVRGDLWKK